MTKLANEQLLSKLTTNIKTKYLTAASKTN